VTEGYHIHFTEEKLTREIQDNCICQIQALKFRYLNAARTGCTSATASLSSQLLHHFVCVSNIILAILYKVQVTNTPLTKKTRINA